MADPAVSAGAGGFFPKSQMKYFNIYRKKSRRRKLRKKRWLKEKLRKKSGAPLRAFAAKGAHRGQALIEGLFFICCIFVFLLGLGFFEKTARREMNRARLQKSEKPRRSLFSGRAPGQLAWPSPPARRAARPRGRTANRPGGRTANRPGGRTANRPRGRQANRPRGRQANRRKAAWRRAPKKTSPKKRRLQGWEKWKEKH